MIHTVLTQQYSNIEYPILTFPLEYTTPGDNYNHVKYLNVETRQADSGTEPAIMVRLVQKYEKYEAAV